MRLPLVQVDAFCSPDGVGVFTGNPAAVVPLPGDWLDDATLLAVAAENNLVETAFLTGTGGRARVALVPPGRRGRALRTCDAGIRSRGARP